MFWYNMQNVAAVDGERRKGLATRDITFAYKPGTMGRSAQVFIGPASNAPLTSYEE